MNNYQYPMTFEILKRQIEHDFAHYSKAVHTERWQGTDISKRKEMVTHELLNVEINVLLTGENLDLYRKDIKPNLPWADDHFAERVCGVPLNPGREWANWPWGKSAEGFIEGGVFNHNYMERYWPKFANMGKAVGYQDADDFEIHPNFTGDPNAGIRHEYGDMMDLVKLLANEPLTRQAYIPIFFPEDTGIGDGGRKPCTLGYHFIMREGRLNVWYPLRSCDFIRHFSDDIYLTVRLLLWVLEECRKINPEVWNNIKPGTYSMHCTSLHIFANDMIKLREQYNAHK